MVDFMLDNLCGPAAEGLDARLHLGGLPLHLHRLVALALARAAEQRQTPLLGFVRAVRPQNLGVEHRHIRTVVVKHDDALFHANHIRRHADATVLMRGQRIEQAFTCDELGEFANNNDFSFVISPEKVLSGLPRVDIPKRFHDMILNGIAIRNLKLPEGDFLVYCDNEFLGVGENHDGAKIRIPLY